MEFSRYYSRLVMVGRRNNPLMREAKRDLMDAYEDIYIPFA